MTVISILFYQWTIQRSMHFHTLNFSYLSILKFLSNLSISTKVQKKKMLRFEISICSCKVYLTFHELENIQKNMYKKAPWPSACIWHKIAIFKNMDGHVTFKNRFFDCQHEQNGNNINQNWV